jgi:hypothetical protein
LDVRWQENRYHCANHDITDRSPSADSCGFAGVDRRATVFYKPEEAIVDFRIQDPSWPNSSYLLEVILENLSTATHGAGMFAFASPGGVRLLLRDADFSAFLKRGKYELIVGVDAVTNTAALDAIKAVMAEFPSLSARAFLDDSSQALFHAKFSWFRSKQKSTWIVGSGNLTPGGLRGNVEAFWVAAGTPAEHKPLEAHWREWLDFHAGHLFPLDHPDVLDRAKQNTGRETPERKVKGLVQELLVEGPDGRVAVEAMQSPDDAVLIAELPRGDRWKQADVGIDAFESFFGATPGRTQRVIFTHVDASGNPGPQELRPSVSVRSHNYRFELGAASGLDYPVVARPIAIFVRLATRTFRYHLLMPDSPQHGPISVLLQARTEPRPGGIRRLQTDVRELAAVWPDCPVLR